MSPNVQLHVVGEPVELSVKVTGNDAVPEVGVPVKSAVGAGVSGGVSGVVVVVDF
jgi:hypothetical protein